MLSGVACATIAEVRKRGDEFWSEFEFYLSDLIVGLVLDVLLVGLMATPAVIGKHHKAHNAKGGLPSPPLILLDFAWSSPASNEQSFAMDSSIWL